MFLVMMRIVVMSLFLLLVTYLLKKRKQFDVFIIFFAVITVFIGEMINLLIYEMAVYKGGHGIPLYIVLGGAMLAWGIHALTSIISSYLHLESLTAKLSCVVFLSIFLPLVELFGLKTGLWSWRRYYPISSVGWWLGVWKYYFLFLATPAIAGRIFSCHSTITHSSMPPRTGHMVH